MAGRGHDLNEHLLGVAVLGRPPEYSPTEDSCVRSRAYELRKRLRSYYEAEAPQDPIRIVVDKGGYCPRFERAAEQSLLADAGQPSTLTPELESLWGALVDGSAPLLIVFELRLFFFAPATGLVVRDYQTNAPTDAARSEPLLAFQRNMGAAELRETRDYADFGTVHAAFLLGRLLSGTRADVALKHSGALDWHDLRNNHVVFIGKPNLNPIIASFLAGKPFQSDELGVIRNAASRPGEAASYRDASSHGAGEKYALITRVRGPQVGRYLLLLVSAAAELMWALAESVTNPGHAAELLAHLRTPSGGCAEEFQLIIRATFQSNVPVDIRYVTHHVLQSPASSAT